MANFEKEEQAQTIHYVFGVHTSARPEAGQELSTYRTYVVAERTDQKAGAEKEALEQLQKLYGSIQLFLGEYLPYTRVSFDESGIQYTVQEFADEEFKQTAKSIFELNGNEFSQGLMWKLLDVQDRIEKLLEVYPELTDIAPKFFNAKLFDPKLFKENILYSPVSGRLRLANVFNDDFTPLKKVLGTKAKFVPSAKTFTLLKKLGLASLIEKIEWVVEKSAAPEWIRGRDVHWHLNKEKLKREGKKAMALTFDDGPNEETLELLEILKRQGVKVTFFLVGSLIAGREHIVQRIIDEGHEVGVHEWGQEGARPSAGVKEYAKRFIGPRKDLGDVKRTVDLIEKVTGKRPILGRVAGVHSTVDSLREFQAMGLKIIHADPLDVVLIPPSPGLHADKLLQRSLNNIKPAKIALFHIGVMTDGGTPLLRSEIDVKKGEVYPPEQTLLMIEKYIETSKKQGFEFVLVDEYT